MFKEITNPGDSNQCLEMVPMHLILLSHLSLQLFIQNDFCYYTKFLPHEIRHGVKEATLQFLFECYFLFPFFTLVVVKCTAALQFT